jgi:hypothetical protein
LELLLRPLKQKTTPLIIKKKGGEKSSAFSKYLIKLEDPYSTVEKLHEISTLIKFITILSITADNDCDISTSLTITGEIRNALQPYRVFANATFIQLTIAKETPFSDFVHRY